MHALVGTATVKYVDSIGTVASPGELRGLAGASNLDVAIASGFWAANDGGGGIFYWDATSTASDDGGLTIQKTGLATGRWRRLFEGRVNVKWFGAKGDGSADAASSINAALAAARDVYLPEGIYRVDSTLYFRSLNNIRGANRRGTTIRSVGNHNVFACIGTDTFRQHVLFADFEIENNDAAVPNSSNPRVGIDATTVSHVTVSRCAVRNQYKAVAIGDPNYPSGAGRGQYCRLEDCELANNHYGVFLDRNSNACTVVGGRFFANAGAAVFARGDSTAATAGVLISGVAFEGPSSSQPIGVHLQENNNGFVITGCYFESNATASIKYDDGAYENQEIGNLLDGLPPQDLDSRNTAAFCRLRGSSDVSIADNTYVVPTYATPAKANSLFSSTNPGRVTAKVPGVYQFSANVEWASDAAGIRVLLLVKWKVVAGTPTYKVIACDQRAPVSGARTVAALTTAYRLDAGEWVEVWVKQTSGGSLTLHSTDDISPVLSMSRIG
jgi:hypothetical protein